MKYVKKAGMVISILAMAFPLYILYNYKTINEWWFWVIVGILYDVFIYSVLKYINSIEEFKEKFPKMIELYNNLTTPDGKKFTDKEKYEATIETINNCIINKDLYK